MQFLDIVILLFCSYYFMVNVGVYKIVSSNSLRVFCTEVVLLVAHFLSFWNHECMKYACSLHFWHDALTYFKLGLFHSPGEFRLGGCPLGAGQCCTEPGGELEEEAAHWVGQGAGLGLTAVLLKVSWKPCTCCCH